MHDVCMCVKSKSYLDNVELFERLKFRRGLSSGPRCIEMLSKSSIPPKSTSRRYSGVWSEANVGFLYNFSSSDEQTTDTELAAIAADAIHGCRINPKPLNTPAANGIPSKLYMLANRKFKRMRRTVLRDKSKHATTSSKSFCVGRIRAKLNFSMLYKLENKKVPRIDRYLPA